MAKILITGGAGNIGSFIVDQCLDLGHRVVVVDNFYNGKYRNIAEHLSKKRIELETVDIGSYEMLRYAFDKHKPDYVSHQASLMIMDSDKFPNKAIETNITGTFNIVRAGIEFGVKKLVYASSASVYGNPRFVPVTEDHPFDNQTLYGATKIAKEALMTSWAFSHKLPYVGFRYFNIYSERQGIGAFYTQVFQKWITAIHEDHEIIMYGDGEQTMDLVHASDAAQANVLAMFNDEVKNEFFNVGTGKETSLKQLLEIIERLLDKKAKVKHVETDPHLVRRRCASIEKIQRLLGFEPHVTVEEGTRKYIDYLLAGKI
ncbi:MAG: SDR family NAD(P)-dependent oxidoreductase [Acidobacteria bacterium]|jgi:UDP-glucose 4-epimerase|nr:SDR family NAD(P)-dependent oxidoreductase [Acidobacteriota bacterium]